MNQLIGWIGIIFLLIPLNSSAQNQWQEIKVLDQVSVDSKAYGLLLVKNENCSLSNHFKRNVLDKEDIKRKVDKYFDSFVLVKGKGGDLGTWNRQSSGVAPNATIRLLNFISNKSMPSPSLIVFDRNLNVLQIFPGYMNREKTSKILEYYGSANHKQIPWRKFLAESKMD